jgi:hypothetical protein
VRVIAAAGLPVTGRDALAVARAGAAAVVIGGVLCWLGERSAWLGPPPPRPSGPREARRKRGTGGPPQRPARP